MREVKPTQKPVPSSDIKDLFFNSGLLDIWATSLERKYIDRFGNCHLTAAGMEWLFKELVEKFKVDMNTAIVAAGYITIDSFQQGADLPNNELTQRNHILRDETTGEYYRWDGELPKQVPAGSTPESTGGIGKGAWVSVGDASLRYLELTNKSILKRIANLSNGAFAGFFGERFIVDNNYQIAVDSTTGKLYRWSLSVPKVVEDSDYPSSGWIEVEHKGANIVRVDDFIVDYSVDNTAALNQAIELANKINAGSVLLPQGVLKITPPIIVTGKIIIESDVNSTVEPLANKDLFISRDLAQFRNFNIELRNIEGWASKVFSIEPARSILPQGKKYIDNVNIFTETDKGVALQLTAANANRIGYCEFDINVLGRIGTVFYFSGGNNNEWIQGNNFTGNWNGYKLCDADDKISWDGNYFNGIFQKHGGEIGKLRGAFSGWSWDGGIHQFEHGVAALMGGWLPQYGRMSINGSKEISILSDRSFVSQGFQESWSNSRMSMWMDTQDDPAFGRGLIKTFIDCTGYNRDPRINAYNANFSPAESSTSLVANMPLAPSFLLTFQNENGYMNIPNTGCSLSKFPVLVMRIKQRIGNGLDGGGAGASVDEFKRTNFKFGLLDANGNGFYVERVFNESNAKYPDIYLRVKQGGVLFHSVEIPNKMESGGEVTLRIEVNSNRVLVQAAKCAWNDTKGFLSSKRVGSFAEFEIPMRNITIDKIRTELSPRVEQVLNAGFTPEVLKLYISKIELLHTDR